MFVCVFGGVGFRSRMITGFFSVCHTRLHTRTKGLGCGTHRENTLRHKRRDGMFFCLCVCVVCVVRRQGQLRAIAFGHYAVD